MKERIEAVINKGSISEEIKNQHKGFLEWSHNVTKQNHHPIVKVNVVLTSNLQNFTQLLFGLLCFFQIVIDGRDKKSVDNDGIQLPTLVYLAREKKLDWPHNFKAGAMNALVLIQTYGWELILL